MSTKLFVIIVTYKGHQWYERCFTSLRDSELPVQTVVVDNASNDGTVEYIREYFPEIHLIESPENLGFGRANNIGMRYALDNGCDYVFLLNQDAWIDTNTIYELVKIHKCHNEYGILSPIHLDADRSNINMLLNDGKENFVLLNDLYFKRPREIYTITYANAAAWLLPRITIEKIGGFCPAFFYCGEDDDYMNRLKYHNILMAICPKVCVVHDTRNRLENSRVLAEKANNDDLHNILDINNPPPINLIIYHLRKFVMSLICMRKKRVIFHLNKCLYIAQNLKKIKKIRNLHAKQQANWL